ncbi:MAG: hypothetical protein SFT92_06725 [Rickettsiales bacterium]|nr:hypothetical protein [Rickettsiales bacterium]
MNDSSHPMLYHASPQEIEGGVLIPRLQETCAHWQYKDTPQEAEHKGDFVFAGQTLGAAYAYALKLQHPTETENHLGRERRYDFMLNVGVHKLADDKIVPLAVISRGEEFEACLKRAHPTIYKIPNTGQFTPVCFRDGTQSGEWVSRTAVDTRPLEKIRVSGVDEAMQNGVQIYYLNPKFSKDDWHEMNKNICDRLVAELGGEAKMRVPEVSQEFSRSYLQTMQQCVDNGILRHINAERGIAPFEAPTTPRAGGFRERV